MRIHSRRNRNTAYELSLASPILTVKMTALSVSRPLHSLQLLLTHSDYFTLVAIALLLADAVFCYGIINYISCNEFKTPLPRFAPS